MKHTQIFKFNDIRPDIETWYPVKNFPNYEISSFGRVKLIDKNKIKEYKTRGYATLTLRDRDNVRKITIHHLVAETFLDNPDNLPMINHISEEPTDNNVFNLEFCDAEWNAWWSCSKRIGSRKFQHKKHKEEMLAAPEKKKWRRVHKEEYQAELNMLKTEIKKAKKILKTIYKEVGKLIGEKETEFCAK